MALMNILCRQLRRTITANAKCRKFRRLITPKTQWIENSVVHSLHWHAPQQWCIAAQNWKKTLWQQWTAIHLSCRHPFESGKTILSKMLFSTDNSKIPGRARGKCTSDKRWQIARTFTN